MKNLKKFLLLIMIVFTLSAVSQEYPYGMGEGKPPPPPPPCTEWTIIGWIGIVPIFMEVEVSCVGENN